MRYSLFAFVACLGTIPMLRAAEPETAGKEEPAIESTEAKSKELPTSVDLRPQFKEQGLMPRNQGSRGTCSVFTTAAAIEFAWSKKQNKSSPLSVEYLNWACNQVIHNDRDRGQFFHDLLDAFDQYGVCLESEMPYQQKFDSSLAPSEAAAATAKEIGADNFEINWIKRIGRRGRRPGLRGWRFDEVKQALADGWPVAAGAAHSRLLVGYVDDPASPGGGYFYTKDSGIGRFDRVTYEFVQTEVNDAFWVEPKQ